MDNLYNNNFAGIRDVEKFCNSSKEALSRELPKFTAPSRLAESAYNRQNDSYGDYSRAMEPVRYPHLADSVPAPPPRREKDQTKGRSNAKAIVGDRRDDYYTSGHERTKRNSQQSLEHSADEDDVGDPGRKVKASIPLNDFGRAQPGNMQVDHDWRPSKDADQRAMNDFSDHRPNMPDAGKPSGGQRALGGGKDNYLRWESN